MIAQHGPVPLRGTQQDEAGLVCAVRQSRGRRAASRSAAATLTARGLIAGALIEEAADER